MFFKGKEKILVITNIPNPYRIPLFNELNKQMSEEGLLLKVIFGAKGYSRRKWTVDMSECNFDYKMLSSWKIQLFDSEKTIFTYNGLLSVIRKEKPSLIITLGFSFATTKIWFRSFYISTPFVIWSGAIFRRNRPVSFLRKLHRKILVNRAKGYIAYGTKAKEYLVSLGAEPDNITISLNTVDTEYFRHEVEKFKKKQIKKEKKHLLYVGNLTKGKRIDLLLKTVDILLEKRKDFVLSIVGDGPEMIRLMNLAQELSIIDYVRFEGFRQKIEVLKYLSMADCFLFPSEYDIWGLVLVEAMSAGVTCISSVYAGATHDLIKNGENGFVLNFNEIEKVAQRIGCVLDNPELSNEIGENASRFIAEYACLEKSAGMFVKAIIKGQSKMF